MKMLSKYKFHFLIILFCLVNVHSANSSTIPDEFHGKVSKVIDGDTIYVRNEKLGIVKIRLADIDTPEIKQPYGVQAKKVLEKKLFKKKVKIRKISIDRYKRVIGIVYKENLEINHFLVINGHAWCYERYSERPIIKIAESIAKRKRLGIWKSEKAIPPWEWRKNRK